MGGNAATPQAPAGQMALWEKMAKAFDVDSELMAQIGPELLRKAGYTYKDGALAKMSDEEFYKSMSTSEREMYDINKLQRAKQLAALQGKAEIDPALEQDLSKQQSNMEEYMRRRLGSDWRNSTPGNQAMSQYNRNADSLRYMARHGEETQGLSNMLNTMGANNEARYGSMQGLLMPHNAYQSMYGSPSAMLAGYPQPQGKQGMSRSAQAMSGAGAGALTGAYIGGPWGAAAGGVIGGLGGYFL